MISGIKTHRQTEGNTDGAILDCSMTDQILTTEAYLRSVFTADDTLVWEH